MNLPDNSFDKHRPPGICDRRYQWSYIFTAVRPTTGEDFTLVLPEVSTRAMRLFLDQFADRLPEDTHAVVVLDGAGWHHVGTDDLPSNVSLIKLPPYSPELNAVERIWLHLRERFRSLRLLDDTEAIVTACCNAWNRLTADPERLRSLSAYPWIMKVAS